VGGHAGLSTAQNVAGNNPEFIIHPGHQSNNTSRLGIAFDVLWLWGTEMGCMVTCREGTSRSPFIAFSELSQPFKAF